MRTLTPLLTVRETATALKMSEATVYRLCAAGQLPSRKIGGSVRIPVAELARLVEDGSAPSAHGAAPTAAAGRPVPSGRRHDRSAA